MHRVSAEIRLAHCRVVTDLTGIDRALNLPEKQPIPNQDNLYFKIDVLILNSIEV